MGSFEGPMPNLQTLPSSLRSGSLGTPENSGLPNPDRRPHLVTLPIRKPTASTQRYLSLFPHESEDARRTGATRSLYRRLLALNLPRQAASIEAPIAPREVREIRLTS